MNLKPATATIIPCKICGGPAALYGVVDFHKNCEERRGLRLPLAGIPIYYRRCASCQFLFTDAFDAWSQDDFKKYIYNTDYACVDPAWQGDRSRSSAETIMRLWGPFKEKIRVLDFGGGNGALCAALRAGGFACAVTYDPLVPEFSRQPDGRFDLVASIETLEHLPDPAAGVSAIVESLAEPGVAFFTTVLQPRDFDSQQLSWWYVAPRNGHISLFSKGALGLVWAKHDYKVVSLNQGAHLAFRTRPPYLRIIERKDA
jgi:2-polyprenyl-6-hydroxyphenyl methylase/3-demethylubiquinone-9 3-methyltransferase